MTRGSVYSIVHTVYDAGTKVFRVKIPGGPGERGRGQPAVHDRRDAGRRPPALTPEAPGNTSLPAEGQT